MCSPHLVGLFRTKGSTANPFNVHLVLKVVIHSNGENGQPIWSIEGKNVHPCPLLPSPPRIDYLHIYLLASGRD
jgi:hypothetical protein